MRNDIKNSIKNIIQNLRENGISFQDYDDLLFLCQVGFIQDVKCKYEYKYYLDYVKEVALKEVINDKLHADMWRDLFWRSVKLGAYHFFEDYLIYMERKRPYEKRFYEPRKKTLKLVVDDLQKLEDSGDQKMYCLSLPSRTGKSTMIVFFLTWVVLRKPLSHNAMGTHSGLLADHFYKEFLDIFETPEYCFEELYNYFQPNELFLVDKSAEKMTISFAQKGDFPTITCRGIDGTWTGAVDISSDGYLCVDDLVRDRTHSLSPKRMNDTFSEYLNKMVDRKNAGAKELLIGTLWNVLDPIKRLEEMYEGDDRYVFRKIPALNENDESNFDYEIKGFPTEYYREMREKMIKSGNEPEWFAKFQQAPYVREGLLFSSDELRFFNGILPQGHTFKYVVVCDVAFGGGDSVSLPIGLQDNETGWLYVVDWYFNSGGVKTTVPAVIDKLMKFGIKDITFERNNGGLLYAKLVQEELQRRNYACSCDTRPAPNNIDKQGKIKAYEAHIKSKVIFLDGTKHNIADIGEEVTVYQRSPEYERALSEMQMFVAIGKNDHDDAADSIAQLCSKAFGDINSVSEVETIDRAILGF